MNDFKSVKVSDALKKGVIWINFPAYLFLFFFLCLLPLILIFSSNNSGENDKYFMFGTFTSMILGATLPFLWYFFNVVNYKIWVSKNVKDIHRFYIEAQSKKLINESDFFKKFEIKTKSQKKELEYFYKRIKDENKFVIDINPDIENETVFKSYHNLNLILFAILLAILIYMYFTNPTYQRKVLVLIPIFIGMIIYEFYKKSKLDYILKINRDFISYKDEEVKIYWRDILQYEISNEHGSYGVTFFLNILTNEKNYKLKLDGIYKIKTNKIISVLNENKHRFDVKNQTL